jgi:maltooligosyltrehalose trehalohydrolase
MLHELSREVGKLAADTGRLIHLVLENDDNRATLLDPATNPPRGKYRAQWNDDYHHAWHVLLTGEDKGYYSDYAPKPLDHIVRALGSGFAYQGQSSAHRDGAPRGEPSGELAPAAFVNFLQNHDQIGNRALGDRLETLAKPEAIEAALADYIAGADGADAVSGRGMGLESAVSVLLRFRGRSRQCRAQWPQEGIRQRL